MIKQELIKSIIENQRVLNRYLSQYEPDIWLDLNLTIAQVKSLFYLANHDDVNFRTLAKALKVTPSNVTGIIDRLSEQDLVIRESNPADRRMLMLKLTARGQKLIASLRERRVTKFQVILNGLSEKELAAINEGFSLISSAVQHHIDLT